MRNYIKMCFYICTHTLSYINITWTSTMMQFKILSYMNIKLTIKIFLLCPICTIYCLKCLFILWICVLFICCRWVSSLLPQWKGLLFSSHFPLTIKNVQQCFVVSSFWKYNFTFFWTWHLGQKWHMCQYYFTPFYKLCPTSIEIFLRIWICMILRMFLAVVVWCFRFWKQIHYSTCHTLCYKCNARLIRRNL